MKKAFLKKLTVCIIILAVLMGSLVIFFDPFFHYHKPIRPLKEVLTQAEYQVIGTLRTFDYDALIAGSSMAENYDNSDFDEAYDCSTVKAVKPGADTADLVYLINEAFKEQEVEKVFYTLDISALTSSKRHSFVKEGMPEYLYNHNPFDDIQYLLNKDVIFKDIPYMIATSFVGDYNENYSYYWAEGKDFTTLHYEPVEEAREEKQIADHEENILYNVHLLTDMVSSHPETEFIFIVPPYSSLWWYETDRNGELELCLYAMDTALSSLLEQENVSIHYYQHLEDIVADLNLFMDLLHFHPQINEYIVETTVTGEHRLTVENKDDILEKMCQLASKCIEVYSKEYFNSLQVDKNS